MLLQQVVVPGHAATQGKVLYAVGDVLLAGVVGKGIGEFAVDSI